jgi:hypothetical protein
MKSPLQRIPALAAAALLCPLLPAQTLQPAAPAGAPRLSAVSDGEKLTVTPPPKGSRRNVFAGPTATVDQTHSHTSPLHPGEKSGEPSKPLQAEVIVVKEGAVEAHGVGQSKTGGPGSVIFLAADATTFLRHVGPRPAPTS